MSEEKKNQDQTTSPKLKIFWDGLVYNATGWATVGREMCYHLLKRKIPTQCNDFYTSEADEMSGYELKELNKPIDMTWKKDNIIGIHGDYPRFWKSMYGRNFGYLIHEGTRVHKNWPMMINQIVERVLVLSKASKNLAKWNGIDKPIHIVPAGVNPDMFKPAENNNKKFVFSFVNSWTGEPEDRKGFPLLLKAFTEEFEKEKDVVLFAKLSTFWQNLFDVKTAIRRIIGKDDERIFFNNALIPRKEVAEMYQKSNCVVLPTNGESFGLTIAEAMACGVPVIVTKDKNSGHMDFTKDYVHYIETTGEFKQGSRRFYCEGNLFPKLSLDSLKKQMRYVYEHREKSKELALKSSEYIRKNFSWDKAVDKLLEVINEQKLQKGISMGT